MENEILFTNKYVQNLMDILIHMTLSFSQMSLLKEFKTGEKDFVCLCRSGYKTLRSALVSNLQNTGVL